MDISFLSVAAGDPTIVTLRFHEESNCNPFRYHGEQSKSIPFALADLLAAGIVRPKEKPMTTRLTGTVAPDFTLPGSDDNDHSLQAYRGQHVVLYFYPKDDTPGCTKESCSFRDLHSALRSANTVVFGISRDSLESHGKFVAKYDLPFVLLSDPELDMIKAYGAWGEKNRFGKKVEGILRSTVVIGPNGTIARHWPSVRNAEEHPQEVADFIADIARQNKDV